MLLFSALFIMNSIHKEGLIHHVSQKPQSHVIKTALETKLELPTVVTVRFCADSVYLHIQYPGLICRHMYTLDVIISFRLGG